MMEESGLETMASRGSKSSERDYRIRFVDEGSPPKLGQPLLLDNELSAVAIFSMSYPCTTSRPPFHEQH